MKKNKKNCLDLVPVILSKHKWDITDEKVTVHVEHKGVFAWIAQKIFRRPKTTHIDLDDIGSFIFPLIDGKRTVGELALMVKEKFGDSIEPLYERLIKYLQILINNGLIEIKK